MGRASSSSASPVVGIERPAGLDILSRVAGKPSAMNRFGLLFHHFGLAVPGSDDAFRFLEALGYRIGPIVFDPLQMVNLAMCTHREMPDVEVIWPSDLTSPIDRILRRNGAIVYHLCYVAISHRAAVAALEEDGFNVTVISEAKPAVLFGGRDVSFYSVDGIGLIELIDGEPPKPDMSQG